MRMVLQASAASKFTLLCLIILALSLPLGCAAFPDPAMFRGFQENPDQSRSEPTDSTVNKEAVRKTAEDEEESKNFGGVFLGVTHKNDKYGFSIGAMYERRITELVGIGLILENTPQISERIVTLPSLFLHPYGGLSLALAPGFEFTDDDDTSYMLRVGAGWDFELGKGFTIAPELNYDFVYEEKNAVVFGITLGVEF